MCLKTVRFLPVLVPLLLLASLASVAVAAGDSTPTIRVGIKEAPPLILRGEEGRWHGPAVMLWERIAETHQLEFAYEEYDLEGLFAAVEAGEVDIAVGALSMLPEREERIDFSHPYFLSGLGIAVRHDESSGWVRTLSRLVSRRFLYVVGALAIVLLASGLAVWLFERKRNPEMFGGPVHQGVGSGFWWAAVTMTTVGYGDKAPQTTGGRLIALFWMFTSLIIVSGFTAAIASALTVGALDSSIEVPDGLRGIRVATVAGSSSVDWLANQGIGYRTTSSVEEALDLLREERADAVVYDAPVLDFYARSDPSGSLLVLDRRFDFRWYAFALPSGSDAKERLNREILKITAGEEWRKQILEAIGREP